MASAVGGQLIVGPNKSIYVTESRFKKGQNLLVPSYPRISLAKEVSLLVSAVTLKPHNTKTLILSLEHSLGIH